MPKTIMLIHGAWLTPAAWQPFKTRYESLGYICLAPPWPYNDLSELKRSPHTDFAKLSIKTIVAHYQRLITRLPEPPILIGHAFGGLFVQLLLDRGFGAAGIAIDPAPPRGVLPSFQAIVSALPVLLTWRGWSRAVTMSFSHFAATFAQTLSAEEQKVVYERYIVPAPGRLYFEGALGIGTGLNFRNARRPPLLLMAGDKDRTVEISMVRATFEKHQQSPGVTAFKALPGRDHWLLAAPGWEEIADEAIKWAVSVA
jgi:pimeloyl-ACP methyl ester carboxylesterase